MKDIILLWIQWSWKGTLAKWLLEHFWHNVQYFEMGQILRALMKTPNWIWESIIDTVNSWNLVPAEITIALFQAFLWAIKGDNIFLADGFPREIIQYNAFKSIMADRGRDYIIVQLELSEEEAIQRMQNRRMCTDCKNITSTNWYKWNDCDKCWWELEVRDDDTDIQKIKTRLNTFFNLTWEILELADNDWKLLKIDASWAPEEVLEKVISKIG